jgi:hypothetical protein
MQHGETRSDSVITAGLPGARLPPDRARSLRTVVGAAVTDRDLKVNANRRFGGQSQSADMPSEPRNPAVHLGSASSLNSDLQVSRQASLCDEFGGAQSSSDRECPQGAPGPQQKEQTMNSMARRMFELVEPIGVIPYSADEPNEAMFALGFTNYWDTYFAGRAAPLGLAAAEVVDALFYNFAPGEVARHIPKVWRTTTPEAAIAARQTGCVKALRRILGDRVETPAFARAAGLLMKAATSAPFEGRPMYAALRAIPIPDDVVGGFFHAGSLLREHRGDGHIAALMIEGVGGLEAHVLFALDMGMPAEKFGRIHHLPAAQLAAVIDGMRDRGLIGDDGWLSEPGRAVKQRVEALTDDLAARPYESLEPDELDELMATLEPLATLLLAAQD